ncbi:hypothetical protein VE25_03900 [Devosia geojensis]|uniref:AbrB family transcriptional regulator n=1 Tax=Devosia geojensis TaxID=443610 RepID=A0A0F5FY14_9HYPH|nr:hypothetical protein [Devosia geojensis]KKB13047.1 hypothetical protein VE25_03900 [Devosia geojensis]
MRIEKRAGSWALVDVPDEAVKALQANEGDEVSYSITDSKVELVKQASIEETIARIRAMSRPLPPGWKFDREEANKRGSE